MPNPATKVAMQQLAGTEARSFWGWNQIYTMVTKKPGPDPFQLLPPKPDGKPWKRKAIKKYNLTSRPMVGFSDPAAERHAQLLGVESLLPANDGQARA